MKLTRERIVEAGMSAFAEHGYAGLSMRQVATRLDVHAGSLYYHVSNKESLLALLADRVADEAYAAGTTALEALPADADWSRRVAAQLVALRQTLLSRQGAPLLLAASPAMLVPASLSLMERLLETLCGGGVPPESAPVAADLMLSYVTGFVLQEQTAAAPAAGADASVIAELARRFPMTIGHGAEHDAEEMFLRSVELLCAGVATFLP